MGYNMMQRLQLWTRSNKLRLPALRSCAQRVSTLRSCCWLRVFLERSAVLSLELPSESSE